MSWKNLLAYDEKPENIANLVYLSLSNYIRHFGKDKDEINFVTP